MQLSQDEKDHIRQNEKVYQKMIERSVLFEKLFHGADGENALKELDSACGKGFDPDPYVHAYNAGKRFLYDFIRNCINNDVSKAKEMLEQAQLEQTQLEQTQLEQTQGEKK